MEVMKVHNNTNNSQIKIDDDAIPQNKFCYLGSIVSCDGGCHNNIKNQINKAKAAFNYLLPI
jgi:hypothetical protein